MFELLPKQLRVANAIEVRDAKLLFETEIAAVVDVAYEESPARLPRQFVYCRYPLNDGGGNSATMIRLAVRTLVELIRAEMPTAIACSAGVSRSPTIAALAVAELKTVSPNTILQQIAKQRPLQLNAVFWNDALAALSERP